MEGLGGSSMSDDSEYHKAERDDDPRSAESHADEFQSFLSSLDAPGRKDQRLKKKKHAVKTAAKRAQEQRNLPLALLPDDSSKGTRHPIHERINTNDDASEQESLADIDDDLEDIAEQHVGSVSYDDNNQDEVRLVNYLQ